MAREELRSNFSAAVMLIVILGVIGFGFYGFASMLSPSRPRPEPVIRKDAIEMFDAYEAAIHMVQTKLVAPSTAKFPNFSYNSVRTVDYCTWIVTSYVDSQNSFGAMLRTRYRAKVMKLDPSGSRWKLLDLQIYN
jgi:hypothetical protein